MEPERLRAYNREEEYNPVYHVGAFLGIMLLSVLIYGFGQWAWNSPAELGAYDMLLRMRFAPAPAPRIAIVALDAASVEDLGAPHWGRATDARLVRAIRDQGARLIVYDVPLGGPDAASPGVDSSLARVLSAGGEVLLPIGYDPLRNPSWQPSELAALIGMERYLIAERIGYTSETPFFRYYYFTPPFAGFVGPALGLGVDPGQGVGDGTVRSARLACLTRVRYPVPAAPLPRNTNLPRLTGRLVAVPGLPLSVVMGILGAESEGVRVGFGDHIEVSVDAATGARIPIDELGSMMIAYAGPAGSYPTYSARDLLEKRIPEGALDGKVVFAGFTDPALPSAMLGTPYGTMPRVEVNANAVATILEAGYIERTPEAALASILILGVLLGIGFPLLDRWELGPAALIVSGVYVVAAAVVLMLWRLALPVIPSVLLVLLAAVLAVLLKPFLVTSPALASG